MLPAKPVLASTSCARRADQPAVEQSDVDEPASDRNVVAKSVSNEAAVDNPAVNESAVDLPAVEKSLVDKVAVDPSVTDKPAIDQPAVDQLTIAQSAVDQPAVDQSTLDVSTVDKSAVDQSAIDKSGVDKSSVAERAPVDHMDQDLQDRVHSPSPAPRTPSPQPLHGASRTAGGVFRGHATGNAVNIGDLDQQPADHLHRDRQGKVLFYISRDPDARPHLSMKHSVTPSLHSILSDLGNNYSPVRSKYLPLNYH